MLTSHFNIDGLLRIAVRLKVEECIDNINTSKVILGTVKVWCLGSSIIKQAFAVARCRPGGLDLGLADFSLWWQGYSGLNLLEVIPKLKLLKRIGENPDVIMLHCGGNNIGRTPLKSIRWLICQKLFCHRF